MALEDLLTRDDLPEEARDAIREESHKRRRIQSEQEAISQISRLFLTSETLRESFSELARILSVHFQFPIATVELYDEQAREMEFVGAVGGPSGGPEPLRVPVDQTLSGTVARTGVALVELDASQRSEYRFEPLRALGVETFVCVPIESRGRVLGTLSLADPEKRPEAGPLGQALQSAANYLAHEIERKTAEEELRQAQAMLESRVAERTAELEMAIGALQVDVTERKRAEEALAQRERQQAAVAELGRRALGAPGLPALFDEAVAGVARILGAEYCKILELLPSGKSLLLRAGVGWKEGLVGQATVPAESDSQAGYTLRSRKPVIVEDLTTETRFTGPALLRDHNVVSGMSVVIGTAGSPWGVLGVHTVGRRTFSNDDVNFLHAVANLLASAIDRKRAEEALRESEEKYRSLTENSPDGIFLSNEQRFLYVNPRLCEMTGYSRDELMSMTDAVPTLFAPEERDKVLGYARSRVRGTPAPPTYESRGIRKDGEEFFLTLTVSSVELSGTRVLQGTIADITARVRGEKERQRLESQLRHSQKLESLGVLAGGVAHDFNNLLVGMLGHSDLALSKLPPENPARPNIEGVMQAAERAAHLSRQMLAYAGRGQFEFRPTDLNDLVRDNLRLLEAAVPKNVQLSARTAEIPACIEADLGQMQQVIMNLVINGAEAIGERSGRVAISTGFETLQGAEKRYSRLAATELDAGRYVFLEVRDDGPGMDDETLSKVFDPFFTTKFVGRGLGLSALLGTVRGHKGGIDVQSEPGKGTTFRLVFPATEEAPEDAKPVAAEGRLEGTILVIDDEEVVRNMTREMLTPQGLEVLTAESGAAGVALFRARHAEIGLILLDFSMPEMGGEETFIELRKVNPDVPVLLSSGFGQEETTRRFEGRGLTGFIQKPYRIATLLTEVRRCLGKA